MNKEMTIYNELRAAAERVFNDGVQAPVGSYTLSDLAAMGNTKKAPGVAFRSEYNTDNIINISVNGFECSFSASRVFKIARRFEVLAKVSKKNCAIFTRKADSADPVAVFTLDAQPSPPARGFAPHTIFTPRTATPSAALAGNSSATT